jgi:spermidine synthase
MNRTVPTFGFCLAITLGLLLLSLTGPTHAKVLHEERSVYTRIIVEDSNRLRCLKFTLKREDSTQTCINLNYPKRMVFSYTQMSMASLLLNPNPASVLIVGLGGGTLPMALRDLLPETRIDTVEIDEAVVRVAKEYFGYQEDEYNRAIIQDARVYGKRSALRGLTYDLIILDAFNGEYIPEHLMTVEFLEEMRALLSNDGVLVANTFASSQLYDFESATYAAVFGDFLNFRGSSTGNRVILVPQAKLPADQRDALDTRTLRARAAALQDGLKPYGVPITRYAGTLAALSKKKPDWDADTRPLTDQFSPANVLSQ